MSVTQTQPPLPKKQLKIIIIKKNIQNVRLDVDVCFE